MVTARRNPRDAWQLFGNMILKPRYPGLPEVRMGRSPATPSCSSKDGSSQEFQVVAESESGCRAESELHSEKKCIRSSFPRFGGVPVRAGAPSNPVSKSLGSESRRVRGIRNLQCPSLLIQV